METDPSPPGERGGPGGDDASPLVSVVVPTYNRPGMLEEAIGSVVRQTYDNLEILVVDDASETDTREVVEGFGDPRIRYVRREENRGHAAALNTGLRRMSGAYVAFCDDDDRWLPRKIERQVRALRRLPERVGLVYCWSVYVDGEGNVQKHRRPRLRGDVFQRLFTAQPLGGTSTLLIRREVPERVGGFDERLRRGTIGDFLRSACETFEVDFVEEELAVIGVGHGGKRITRSDRQGLESAIQGEKLKMKKFEDFLADQPGISARLNSRIGRYQAQLGRPGEARRSLARAIRQAPWLPHAWINALRALKAVLLGRSLPAESDRTDRT